MRPIDAKDWRTSPEYKKAYWDYYMKGDRYAISVPFELSQEFRDARLAFRRRVNCSPSAETT